MGKNFSPNYRNVFIYNYICHLFQRSYFHFPYVWRGFGAVVVSGDENI